MAASSLRGWLLGSSSAAGGDAALLLLRLGFGGVLCAYHGVNKLPWPQAMIDDAVTTGMPAPLLLVWTAVAIQLVGGLLFAAGLLTRPAAAGILAIMLSAAFIRYAQEPPPYVMKERALAYAAVALAVLVAGPGRYSLDHRWFRDR